MPSRQPSPGPLPGRPPPPGGQPPTALTPTHPPPQLDTVLRQSRQVGSSVLAASAFAKALAYHLCAECGFHGGLFLPMLSMSAMLGAVFMNETGVNKGEPRRALAG